MTVKELFPTRLAVVLRLAQSRSARKQSPWCRKFDRKFDHLRRRFRLTDYLWTNSVCHQSAGQPTAARIMSDFRVTISQPLPVQMSGTQSHARLR